MTGRDTPAPFISKGRTLAPLEYLSIPCYRKPPVSENYMCSDFSATQTKSVTSLLNGLATKLVPHNGSEINN